jgi:hypothetical protein
VARVSLESARERAVNDLAQEPSSDGLTLDEYAERAVAVEQAATVEELEATVCGLPETAAAKSVRGGRWLIGVFGETEQRGRWRLRSHLRIVAALGGVTLDLGIAQPEAPMSLTTVVAVLGGVEIIAPPGVSIQLSGFSLLGGKSDERSDGPPPSRLAAYTRAVRHPPWRRQGQGPTAAPQFAGNDQSPQRRAKDRLTATAAVRGQRTTGVSVRATGNASGVNFERRSDRPADRRRAVSVGPGS